MRDRNHFFSTSTIPDARFMINRPPSDNTAPDRISTTSEITTVVISEVVWSMIMTRGDAGPPGMEPPKMGHTVVISEVVWSMIMTRGDAGPALQLAVLSS